jgi:hypothetical protein
MTSTQPDYMKALDDLFGGMSSGDYLTKLLGGAPAVDNTSTSSASTERTLTDEQKKFGSYGTSRDVAGTDMTNADSVAAMAKRGGWADPYAFSTDMLENVEQGFTGGGESGRDPASFGSARFKQEFADARGITNTGRNLNNVQVRYRQNDDGTYSNEVDGYTVLAGALPGTKTHTALNYSYDRDGKFQGANFEAEETFAQQIAPLVGMAGMAFGMGGLGASLGSSINSSLGLGLGKTGTAMLGGAAVGGGTAALTGQNPVKGALLGSMGAGIGAFNPAGQLGITNPALGGAVNGAISGGARALVTGGDVEDALLGGAVNGGLGGLGRGLTRK